MKILKCGLLGLPNVGKSTLFNMLTNAQVPAANYPFCTIEAKEAIVAMPDKRLVSLAAHSQSKSIIPAMISFVDIAGLIKGAADGKGMGNKFLEDIRSVDLLIQVVRCFEDNDIVHVDGHVNPLRDFDTIITELVLADLEIIERRLQNKKLATEERACLQKTHLILNQGKMLSEASYLPEELRILKPYNLLTNKHMIVLANTNPFKQNLNFITKLPNIQVLEIDLFNADSEARVHTTSSALDIVIQTAYEVLGLISYFTTGSKESRAWTVAKDSLAPKAASAIHSDFEIKFIRGKVIPFTDFIKPGPKNWSIVGKNYKVQDGDVIEWLTH